MNKTWTAKYEENLHRESISSIELNSMVKTSNWIIYGQFRYTVIRTFFFSYTISDTEKYNRIFHVDIEGTKFATS